MFRLLLALAASIIAIPSSAAAQSYAEASEMTRTIADEYFNAYVGLDWDRLEPLLADDASFKDPTARLVFGGVGATDKTAMMSLFREGYAAITEMKFEEDRRIIAGDVAVFEGSLTWTAIHRGGVPVTATLPFVTIIEVKDGKVVSHRDHGDYTPYLEARAEALDE